MHQRYKLPQTVNGQRAVRVKESIMPYLNKSSWKYMLKKPPYKLHGLKLHGLPCFLFTVFVGKPDTIIADALDTIIGYGNTKDIP